MVLTDKLRRAVTLAVAGLLFTASLVPLLTRQKASAVYSYRTLGYRQVKLSNSAGDASGVSYRVRFKIPTGSTLGTMKGVVVTFCDNSPIIGDTTCDLPAGFSVLGATISGFSDGTNDTNPDDDLGPGAPFTTANLSSWSTTPTILTQDTPTTGNNTVVVSDATGSAVAADDVVSFTINGVHNPTANNATFYARIYTYDSDTGATGYTLADPDAGVGNPSSDDGGIALSTAQQITITSKVQEKLTFCVYTAASYTTTTDNNCTGKTGSTILLGDTNGVLDSAGAFVDKTAYFGITTNAAGKAVVRLKGDTLNNGAQTITAVGATPAASTPGSEQFGLCLFPIDGTGLTVYDGTAASPNNVDYTGTNGGDDCGDSTQSSGTGTPDVAVLPNFAFDTTNTNTTYGQIIASKPAGAFSTGNLSFIGNISDTTEPGIYTTTLTFIATGTY